MYEGRIDNPCKECIVFPMCKADFIRHHLNNIYSLCLMKKCDDLFKYFDLAGQDEINEVRMMYGLTPIK